MKTVQVYLENSSTFFLSTESFCVFSFVRPIIVRPAPTRNPRKLKLQLNSVPAPNMKAH